jgi:hypothetical protein
MNVREEGNMDQFMYREIVRQVMLLFAKRNMPRGLIYQPDNDPKRTSRHVSDWCPKKGIQIMEWRSQISDLNVIDHH